MKNSNKRRSAHRSKIFRNLNIEGFRILPKFRLLIDFDAYFPHLRTGNKRAAPIDELKLDAECINLCKALLLRGVYLSYSDGIYLSNENCETDIKLVKTLIEELDLGTIKRKNEGPKLVLDREAEKYELDYIMNCISSDYFGGELFTPGNRCCPAFALDPCISKLVRNLNTVGFGTIYSCEGHMSLRHTNRAVIQFYRDYGHIFAKVWELLPNYVKGGWKLLRSHRKDDLGNYYLLFSALKPSRTELFVQSYIFGEYLYLKRDEFLSIVSSEQSQIRGSES